MVSNRLPVDRVVSDDGTVSWRPSPGGLVAALEPVMRRSGGAWAGWTGSSDSDADPFDNDGIALVPVHLTEEDVADYYEGFSNDTLWPLYHDVISPPRFHRDWWEAYVRVNRRFADVAASLAAVDGTVWVHDYQLQLVPKLLRQVRPDLTIGFFNHIPFPAYGIYAQLPWRTQIIEGLLGADVIGFQRLADAGNFTRAVRRLLAYTTKGALIEVPVEAAAARSSTATSRRGQQVRTVIAKQFPISIDTGGFVEMAKRPDIQARAKEIRKDLGDPRVVILGVDRLDYTKGIRHRLKAYGELLEDGLIEPGDVILVQVASPSRERVSAYRELRDEVELTVGRLNGDFSTFSHNVVSYLHQGMPREEMVALYLAADVMLVTALRDGMNLVAKEYVASRIDNDGVLILSEFAGAADELKAALQVNPHDIAGLKETIMRAIAMPGDERARRMRSMRKRVVQNDVARWSENFLRTLAGHASAESSSRQVLAELEETIADRERSA